MGAPGTIAGSKLFDAADAGPVPTAFVAVAVHVYDFPFDNPLTTIGLLEPEAEPDTPPLVDAHDTV